MHNREPREIRLHFVNRLANIAIVGLNLLIFFLLIRWSIENIRFDLLVRQFERMPNLAVVATVILNVVTMGLYASRLGVLVDQRFRIAFPITILGFGLNSVLPFRLGEIAKLYYANHYFCIATPRLLSATLIEKLFDLSALLVLAAMVVTISSISVMDEHLVIALAGVVAAGFAAVLGFRGFAGYLKQAAGKWPGAHALVAALDEQSRLNHLGKVVAGTLAIWLMNASVVYVGLSGFLPDHQIGFLDACGLLLITALAVAIPTAPAGIGLFEAGIVAYLIQVKGIPKEPALAAAVVYHIVVTVPHLAGMGWILLRKRQARQV